MAFVKTRLPCPDQDKCGSSDAAALDENGKVWCFSCSQQFGEHNIPIDAVQRPTAKPAFSSVENLLVTGEYEGCAERGITADTAKFFKALHTPEKTYYGYFSKDSPTQAIAIKMRYPNKSFPWVGDHKAAILFGQQNFPAGGKYVTITEGECLLPETQVLTRNGWVRLDEYQGGEVYSGEGCWETPLAIVDKEYTGDLVEYVSGSYKLTMTAKHQAIRIHEKKGWMKADADSTAVKHLPIPRVPKQAVLIHSEWSTDLRAKLQVMFSADFTFRKGGDLLGTFSKERKIERCRALLDQAGIRYVENKHSDGKTAFFVHRGHGLDVSKLFSYERDLMDADSIIVELVHWDGNTVPSRAQFEYSTKEKHNAEFIQTCAHLCGFTSTIIPRQNQLGKWFKVSVLLNKQTSSTQRGFNTVPYAGRVMCLQMPSGSLLVRFKDSVSVTGNCDAMAAYQLMGSKYPVVSISNGAQAALSCCKAQYEWLDSFENIVICFDSDKPGQDAAKEVAQLFGGKSKVFKHPEGIKDACEYYQKKRTSDFMQAFWRAERYVPDGILLAGSLRDKLKLAVPPARWLYPWPCLNKMFGGIREAELVTWTAGSGVGKSSMLREVVYKILKTTNDKVGVAFLEETPERTMRGIVGLHLNKRINLHGADYTASEIDAAYDDLELDNRIALWDHWGSTNIDNVISRLKFFVKAMDCPIVILDHLSIVISGEATQNERQKIDELMTRLRTEVVQSTLCSLHVIVHLTRPDGKPLENGAPVTLSLLRGSGSIARLSDAVIAGERNTQADDASEKNIITLRSLKSREVGDTGIAGYLQYDKISGRLTELDESL